MKVVLYEWTSGDGIDMRIVGEQADYERGWPEFVTTVALSSFDSLRDPQAIGHAVGSSVERDDLMLEVAGTSGEGWAPAVTQSGYRVLHEMVKMGRTLTEIGEMFVAGLGDRKTATFRLKVAQEENDGPV